VFLSVDVDLCVCVSVCVCRMGDSVYDEVEIEDMEFSKVREKENVQK